MTLFYNGKLEDKLYNQEHFTKFLNSGDFERPTTISFVNPYSYKILTSKNKEICEQIDYWYSDGGLLCKLVNLSKKNKINRVSFDFSSIAEDVFLTCLDKKYKIIIIGGTDSEIKSFSKYVSSKYIGLDICFYRNGYFNKRTELDETILKIVTLEPDIVIAGLGTPLQESFIIDLCKKMNNKSLLFTCGGFITQTCMGKDFYHPLIKRWGLRWLQRAVQQRHVRSRLLKHYPIFIVGYSIDIFLLYLKRKKI
ncbi:MULTISPECIES: WecB/TagA/CpsF family glycosyltransferase [Enterobacteriaceae]|uniref:WecB/TagA/CpsF family glycosyltransferase n=1 Tax=Enterobacteriaceae TaxID=543 RepID=UPI0022F03796|nr:WecB/TagA/CpsF family glycosyltransferase [Enterobacter hormaechei]MDA4642605.1 WecB/TagA/CpsF family glycosyltransferase [Enterobacter hormaechei]MDA4842290.1 WecB/TagA/CpsF family glycosyltransferase [Enterobacter hormaechei]